MCGHIQAKLRHIRGLGDPKLCQNPNTNRDKIHSYAKANVITQTPHDVAMQNGKLSGESQWRTLGVPPPHCKSNHKSHMAALIWKQDRAPRSGNARAKHRHQHHCLHQANQVPHNRTKDLTYRLITCLVRPEKKGTKTIMVGARGPHSTLPGRHRNTNCQPTDNQAPH
jgi:hypothetical protein